jgi:hypothetical protein
LYNVVSLKDRDGGLGFGSEQFGAMLTRRSVRIWRVSITGRIRPRSKFDMLFSASRATN